MPDTVLGLAILILLFIPGVVFVIQVDNRRPTRDLSPLRELVSIAAVGALCDFVVLFFYAFLKLYTPFNKPFLTRILYDSSYAKHHIIDYILVLAVLLIASCGLAYILGQILAPGCRGSCIGAHNFYVSMVGPIPRKSRYAHLRRLRTARWQLHCRVPMALQHRDRRNSRPRASVVRPHNVLSSRKPSTR